VVGLLNAVAWQTNERNSALIGFINSSHTHRAAPANRWPRAGRFRRDCRLAELAGQGRCLKVDGDTLMKSPGWRAFTMIELLVVIAIIAILAGLLLPAVIGGLKKAEITQAQTEIRLIEAAIKAYRVDYGKYPNEGPGNDELYWGYDRLMDTLMGSNVPGSVADLLCVAGCNWRNQNPRERVYLQVSEKSIQTNAPSGSTVWITVGKNNLVVEARRGELADPWGNRYVAAVSMNHDGKVGNGRLEFGDGEVVPREVAVWSWGPTNQGSQCKPNKDDKTHIRSWR
jgi:prepilin-type N-terminal cleavage/methylation domain-containing protein